MKWPQSQNNKGKEEEVDVHNQPTEPMQRLVLPAYIPPTAQASPPSEEQTISTFPVQQAPTIPQQGPLPPENPQPVHGYSPPLAGAVYPVLPSLPAQPQQNNQPAGKGPAGGGIGGTRDIAQPQGVQAKQKESKILQRHRLPLYVGLFFVAVQFLLLTRFVMNFLNLPSDNTWRVIVFTFSDAFLLPFYLLFGQMTLPVNVGVALYTLLAILVYGIISRVLVRLLKTVLRTRQAQKSN